MSTLRTIRGLSGAGFRVPDSTSGKNRRLNENTSLIVDLDNVKTQLILSGERDNFIRTTELGTFTVTIASPSVFTKSAHRLANGDIVYLSTTGALPTGFAAGTKYYVVASTTNTFELSLTLGGSAINGTGSQSGTHTVTPVSAAITGITTYGIRIKDNTGAYKTVKRGLPGHAIATTIVDLTDGDTKRNLRRSYGRYVYVGSATPQAVNIRGIAGGTTGSPGMTGFEIDAGGSGSLLSNNTNVSNGDTVTIGVKTYTFKTNLSEVKATNTVTTSGTPASVRATGTITTSGTGAVNNDTVTVGGVTYTFKTTLTGAANEVLRTGVEDVDITNLVSAINASAGSGTTYGTGTVANPLVSAGAMAAHATTVTSKSYLAANGNAIGLSKTGSVISVSGATLAGGTNESVTLNGQAYTFVESLDSGTAYEVLINGQDTSLTNLEAAINGTSGAGTTYGTGTVASAQFSAGDVSSHAITLTALVPGVAGNAWTAAKVGSHLAVGGATFSGGVNPNPNEVHIGGSADASLTNLGEAVNAGANVGVDYSTNTSANADATAGAVATHTLPLTLVSADAGYDPVVLSTTAVTLTVGAFSGGLKKVYRNQTATVNLTQPRVYTQLRRFFKKWIEV